MTQIFYYSAPWCDACQTYGPLVTQVVGESGATLVSLSTDDEAAFRQAIKHHIKVVPTLVKEVNGVPKGTLRGAVDEEALRSFVEA